MHHPTLKLQIKLKEQLFLHGNLKRKRRLKTMTILLLMTMTLNSTRI